MPVATSPRSLPLHAHGVPNWIDLHTAHTDEARVFYEALLGWTYRNRFTLTAVPDVRLDDHGDDRPADVECPVTTLMALSNDKPVAELVERSETFEDMGLLSNWFPYVYVDDLDTALGLVEPAGGLVLNPPADRGTMARVATILDPSDALLCLWEPIEVTGTTAMHWPGALTWIELETPDIDLAAKFYGELFGWDAGHVPLGDEYDQDGTYTIFTARGDRVAGAIEAPMAGIPASWCPSFAVADVDVATVVAARNGGVLMAEPLNLPVGRQAVIVDPVGAAFSILGPISRRPRPL